MEVTMSVGALLAALFSAATVQPSDTVPACRGLADGVAKSAVAADLAEALIDRGRVVRWVPSAAASIFPFTVWIQPAPGNDVAMERAVLDGADGWTNSLRGLTVIRTPDSSAAHVRFLWTWAMKPDGGRSAGGSLVNANAGRATLSFDSAGAIHAAVVVLATAAPSGMPYQLNDIRALARHEFGHVLGLAHHRSPISVMAPLVVSEQIAGGDRDALRALYALPVGMPCR
jgi:hypothetical protein